MDGSRARGPTVLCILDGFGIAPPHRGNAVARARKPVFDALIREYPTWTLRASGLEVGLPRGEMGNSEVGHLNIGAGRVFYQNRPRIDQAIQSGAFFENPEFLRAAAHVRDHRSTLHLVGLVSRGGVHSHQDHCVALLEFAKRQRIRSVAIHAILDGRDAIYHSGKGFVRDLLGSCKRIGVGRIATLSGRYYAMDRDHRWDRTERAYRAIVDGVGERATDPIAEIDASYRRNVYDEEFVPTVIESRGAPVATIRDGDAIIGFNFRADRSRQLTEALIAKNFSGFECDPIRDVLFVAMMEYEAGLPYRVAYPREDIPTCLAKVWSERRLRQLHIAETEKYAHVTFFFNGLSEREYPGEERVLIPSRTVDTYDAAPEMSAEKITDRLLRELHAGAYDVAVVNYANPDMVGHTGKIEATIRAVEVTDECIGKIAAGVHTLNGSLIITADHGNAEELLNLQTNAIDKEHATNPVPCTIVDRRYSGSVNEELRALDWDLGILPPAGILADVAPTVLTVMGLRPPKAMTGQSLV